MVDIKSIIRKVLELFINKDYKKIINLCNKILENNKNKEYIDLYIFKAMSLEKLEKYEEAINNCNIAINFDKDYFISYIIKSLSLKSLEKYEEAIDNCDIAIGIKMEACTPYMVKALIFKELNQYDKVINILKKAVELYINVDIVGIDLFFENSISVVFDGYTKFINLLDECIKVEPNNFYVFFNKAEILRKYRDIKALKYYYKCIKIDPDNFESYYGKALLLKNSNKYKETEALFNKAIECHEKTIKFKTYKLCEIYIEKSTFMVRKYNFYKQKYAEAKCFMKVKNYNKALNSYEECIKINPNDFNLYANKAELLKELERYEEVIKCYDKCIKISPNNSFIYLNKSELLKNLEDMKKL